MAERQAAHFRALGCQVLIDEPYQHYQFAGRADLAAWHPGRRALLHVENRSRFPNLQEAAGSWNGKRAYLFPSLVTRLGLEPPRSVTHAMVALWSAEVIHVIRIREQTFRSLCPDAPDAFEAWWAGEPPVAGLRSTLVLFDPCVPEGSRMRPFVGLDRVPAVRPRHRGYREAVKALSVLGRA